MTTIYAVKGCPQTHEGPVKYALVADLPARNPHWYWDAQNRIAHSTPGQVKGYYNNTPVHYTPKEIELARNFIARNPDPAAYVHLVPTVVSWHDEPPSVIPPGHRLEPAYLLHE